MNPPAITAQTFRHIRRHAAGRLLYAMLIVVPFAAQAQSGDSEPLRVELISEHLALVPGESAQLGLRLRHEPHWHSYWINPGDSGLPTTLAWTLPPGFEVGDIAWPLPQRFKVGGLYNFGYDGEQVLPFTLQVPEDAKPGTMAHLVAVAKWLVCREECIPGKAELALDLPVAPAPVKPDPRWTMQFSAARLAQPQATAWTGRARVEGDRILVTLRGAGLPQAGQLDAFAMQRKLFDNRPPSIRHDGDSLVIETGRSEYFTTAPSTFDLVLTAPTASGERGWKVPVALTLMPLPASP